MPEDSEDPLEVDVLVAAMQMDKAHATELLESLAVRFEQALPENTEVKRGGGIFSKKKVEQLTLKFGEFQYQLEREKTGSVCAREMKAVRGVVLKTSEIGVDECIKRIAQQLSLLADKNSAARQTLQQFLLGY